MRFTALSREQLGEIVELQVARVIARVRERGVEVTLTEAARELLGDLGYDPTYGARPLRRVIQKQLTDRLALVAAGGQPAPGRCGPRGRCGWASSRSSPSRQPPQFRTEV